MSNFGGNKLPKCGIIMRDVETQILKIERKWNLPGTSLSRCLKDNKLQWVLAIGPMGMPKDFFYGYSIEEVLNQAKLFE